MAIESIYTIFISFVIGFLAGLVLIYLTVLFKKILPIRKRHGFKNENFHSLEADTSITKRGRRDYSSKDY